jgi:glycosyltransferase involved in cell wall biosynthesis
MSLPSKLTSYMMAGRPILGTVRPDGATARELAASGAGWVVEGSDARHLLRAIQTLSEDAEKAAVLGERGRRYATTDLSPETSLSKFAGLVKAG